MYVLVIVIVAIFFSHSCAIHSNTKLLVQYLILHIGILNTRRQCCHRRTQRLSYVTFCCVFSFTSVGYALWRCRRSRNNCLGYGAFSVPTLCLCFFGAIWCTPFQTDRTMAFQFQTDTETILMCIFFVIVTAFLLRKFWC